MVIFLYLPCGTSRAQDTGKLQLVPVIDGDFWQIAGNPDLGDLSGETQQPVDFAIWQ